MPGPGRQAGLTGRADGAAAGRGREARGPAEGDRLLASQEPHDDVTDADTPKRKCPPPARLGQGPAGARGPRRAAPEAGACGGPGRSIDDRHGRGARP
jgi:hypothetical protein